MGITRLLPIRKRLLSSFRLIMRNLFKVDKYLLRIDTAKKYFPFSLYRGERAVMV